MREKITWAAKRNLAAMGQAENVAELDQLFVNGLFIARRAHKAGMIALADRMIESYEMNQMRLQFQKMQLETQAAVSKAMRVPVELLENKRYLKNTCFDTPAQAALEKLKQNFVLQAPNWVKSRVLPTPQMTPSFFEIVEISNRA